MRWKSWLAVIAVCALIAVGLGYYKYTDISAAIAAAEAFPERVEAVEVYEVRRIQQTPTLSVTGEVVARRSADLRMELPGRIVAVGFAPGASVRQGQTLVQLDVTQEQAQLAEARAEQQIARLALDRAKRLVASGAGSVEARDQAQARFAAAGARARALEAVIAKKTVLAPFDGVAGLHQLEVGQFVDSGLPITELIGSDASVWVDFALPQDYSHIGVGAEVSVRWAAGERTQPAKVIARDATVNVRSRNLRLRAELAPQAGRELIAGMLVDVLVDLDAARMVTVVPATAVRRDALGASVYVLEEVVENGQQKTRARKRPVELASITDRDQSRDIAVVASGLQVGERIAAVGAFKLSDGSLVLAQTPNPEAQNRRVGN